MSSYSPTFYIRKTFVNRFPLTTPPPAVALSLPPLCARAPRSSRAPEKKPCFFFDLNTPQQGLSRFSALDPLPRYSAWNRTTADCPGIRSGLLDLRGTIIPPFPNRRGEEIGPRKMAAAAWDPPSPEIPPRPIGGEPGASMTPSPSPQLDFRDQDQGASPAGGHAHRFPHQVSLPFASIWT